MLNATAEAPVRANKAPPKTKAAPFPALASVAPEDKGAKPTSDEQFVAATLRDQVVAIYETRCDDLRGDGIELLHAAAEELEELPQGAYAGLYRACSFVAGAIALERESSPPGAAITQLEAVLQSLDTASAGYNVEMEPYEAMAAGIRAGQHQPPHHPSSRQAVPEALRTSQAASTADEAKCIELARQAAYEIQKLAEAMQIVNMQLATEDHPMTNGIMARIIALSEIVFHAAALHGEGRHESRPLKELQRAFEGGI